MPHPHELPVFSIQCDWHHVLRESYGEVWVSCKFHGEKSAQGRITCQMVPNVSAPNVQGHDGFSVGKITRNTIEVTHNASEKTCVFIAPRMVYADIHSKSVLSLAVTPNSLCVSACTQNRLLIWDVSTAMLRRSLEGHVGAVYKCRFFPSGVVVLSGGADMQLKIWSAETGQCPVTLCGHTAAVTDLCIVDRGRNIISVSKDGTAKLWDCGRAACLGDLVKVHDTFINCCSLGVASNKIDLGEPQDTPSDREVGTEDKILVVGCEDGSVHVIAVRSRRQLFSFAVSSAVNCVALVSDDQFLVGCQSGQILVYSMQEAGSAPVKSWFESNSSVLSLLLYKQLGFFVGLADGSCIYYRLPTAGDNVNVRIQLTGPDCDPVYDIATDGTCVYTACRDTNVRMYRVQDTISSIYHS